jgi:hypothetical protein
VKYAKIKVNFAGGSPAASYFSCLAKKSNQKKSPPVYRPCGVPCVAQLVRRLRNSHCVFKQSSPTSPDQPALLGGAQGKWMVRKEHIKVNDFYWETRTSANTKAAIEK